MYLAIRSLNFDRHWSPVAVTSRIANVCTDLVQALDQLYYIISIEPFQISFVDLTDRRRCNRSTKDLFSDPAKI